MMFSIIILTFVRIPLKISKILFPYLFPIKVTIGDPIFHSSLDIILFYVLSNLLQVDGVRPRSVLTTFYRFLFETIGDLLDLKDYLFVTPQERKPNMFLIRITYLLTLVIIVGIIMMIMVLSLPCKFFISFIKSDNWTMDFNNSRFKSFICSYIGILFNNWINICN